MHSDAGMWAAKVERLSSLIRHLRSAIIHVNTSISEDMLCSNLALVQQLKGIEVRQRRRIVWAQRWSFRHKPRVLLHGVQGP